MVYDKNKVAAAYSRALSPIEQDIKIAHQFALLRKGTGILMEAFPGSVWLPKLKALLDWAYETDLDGMTAEEQLNHLILFLYGHMTTEGAKRAVKRDLKPRE